MYVCLVQAATEALGASVPYTPVKFVHGLGRVVEPVHLIPTGSDLNGPFAPVERMRDDPRDLLGIFPFQPLVSFQGLLSSFPIPTAGRFKGQGAGGQMFFAVIPHAGRGDGEAFLHGVEIGFSGKFPLRDFAPGFQHLNVRLTVGYHFLVQIEFAMLHGLVPFVKVLSHARFHAIGVVIPRLGPRAHVLLMGPGAEQCGKNPFLLSVRLKVEANAERPKRRKHKLSLNVNCPAFRLRILVPTQI